MMLIGEKILDRLFDGQVQSVKMIFNHLGAVLFPVELQHNQQGVEGIVYRDDYGGSALAAVVSRELIEIRFHKSFTDSSVQRIVTELLQMEPLQALAGARVTYQGREVPGSRGGPARA